MPTDSRLRLLVVAASFVLAACTDHPTPGEPQFEPWPEIRGLITTGSEPGIYVTVSGSVGIKRVISPRDTLGHYVSAVAELELPYIVDGGTASGMIPLTALGFDTGLVNVTPLTTLATSQALSEFDLGDITEQRLYEAQGRMAAYLQESFGFVTPPSTVNWSSLAVAPVPGDPMYDTLTVLTTAIENGGMSVYAIVEALAQQGSLCRQMKLTLGGGQTGVFCPSTRVSTPDENDASLVTYSFIAMNNDSLVVVAQGTTVQSVTLYQEDGALTCTACTSLAVGAPGAWGERALTFTSLSLQGATPITLTGAIIAPPSGVTLPPLYCTDRRFLMIKPDRTAVGDCFGEFPGGVSFSAGRKTWYHFGSSGWGFEIDTDMDNNVISMVYAEQDPETFSMVPKFACELTGCAGLTIGELVTDPNWGSTRRITFTDLRLAEVQGDSTLSTTTFAVLNYSAVMMTLDGMDPNPIPECSYHVDSLVVTGSHGIPSYSLCPAPNDPDNFIFTRQAYTQEDGAPAVFAQDDQLHSMSIMLEQDGTTIRQVLWQGGNVMGLFGNCRGSECQGVTLSPPDGEGKQVMTFANTVLREPRMAGVKLTTARAMTVNGTIGDIMSMPSGAATLRHVPSPASARRPGHPGAPTRAYRGAPPR